MNGSTNAQVSAIAAFVSVALLWLAGYFFPDLMATAPEMLGELFTGFLIVVAGVYFAPDAGIKSLPGTGTGTDAKSPAIVGILAIVLASLAFAGCSGTMAAYKAAEGVEETASVVANHYIALVAQANDLEEQGLLAGSSLTRAQEVERATKPVIQELTRTARAYKAFKNATTEADLQRAVSDAAIAVDRLINAIKGARGTTSMIETIERDLVRLRAQHPFMLTA